MEIDQAFNAMEEVSQKLSNMSSRVEKALQDHQLMDLKKANENFFQKLIKDTAAYDNLSDISN